MAGGRVVRGCRFRYEELPAHIKAQVDAVPRPAAAQLARSAGPSESRTPRGRRQPNKTEAAYRAEVLDRRGDVAAVHYEGLTLHMANGHRYTPDWVVVTDCGGLECHEVKGGYALHSHQRARLAFDQARIEFPWIAWTWATRTKHGWKIGG